MAALRDVYQAANKLGEAAIWHAASKRLLWIDLYDPKLFIHDPAKGETQVREIALKAPLGAIAATANSKLLIVSHAGGLSTLNIKTGATKIFARPEQDRDAIIYNDCKADRFGRLWVGSSHAKETDPRGALWCVLPNEKCFLGDVGFAVSNGPAFSLDGRIMYFNDSVGKKTFAYDISPDDPMPRNRRVLISYTLEEGMPDGLTVDAEGNLWVAHWGGARITQFTSSGFQASPYSGACPACHVGWLRRREPCHPLCDDGTGRDEPRRPAPVAAVRQPVCHQTGGSRA